MNRRPAPAMRGSIGYGDILSLPMRLGMSIPFISIPAEVSRRGSLDDKGVGRDILIILLGFAIAFFIIGVVIPLIQR